MYSHYLRTVLISVVATLSLVAAINYFVDPYDLSGYRVRHVNELKPATGRQLFSAKLAQLVRVKPTTILTGNSRVDVGFDPASSMWPIDWRPVYNFGLPGVGPTGLETKLAQALEDVSPHRVIIGLDFLDFLVTSVSVSSPAQGETVFDSLSGTVETVFSLDALIDSGRTVMAQSRRYSANLMTDGFNPLEEYVPLVAFEGHSVLFDQRERENLRNYIRPDRRIGELAENPQAQALERTLESLNRDRIETILFVHPYHARILEALRQTGRWPELEIWRRYLAQLADKFGVQLLDFAMYGKETQEPVPAPGDTRALEYYWEAGHYKSAMGDKLINELTGGSATLGVRLNSEDIARHLEMFLDRGSKFAETRPDVVAEIQDKLEADL